MEITTYVEVEALTPEERSALAALAAPNGGDCQSTRSGYICSRALNHDGPHVACAGRDHFCAAWPNIKAEGDA